MFINDTKILLSTKEMNKNNPKLVDSLFSPLRNLRLSRNILSSLITNHKWIKTGLSWNYFFFLTRTTKTNFVPLSKPKLLSKPKQKEIKELILHLQHFFPFSTSKSDKYTHSPTVC